MRNPTVTPYLAPEFIAESPLEAADWVLERLALLGGEGSDLHQQIAALKDAALLRGEYPELEAALGSLATGCVAQRLVAKHCGTGKYMAAKLGWVHRGRVQQERTGMDDWHRMLAHCSRLRAKRQQLARGQAAWDAAMQDYRTAMHESRRLWKRGECGRAVDVATQAAVHKAESKLDPDVAALFLSNALRKHRRAAGLGPLPCKSCRKSLAYCRNCRHRAAALAL
jgi:hypothetical protein